MPSKQKPVLAKKPVRKKETHLARIIDAHKRACHWRGRVTTLTDELASTKKSLKAAASELLEQIDDPMGTLFDDQEYSSSCEEALSPKEE